MSKIETREHLLNTLAEASELEHNLLCLYLYAVFSMKDSKVDGITDSELKNVQSWKKTIREIAIQEMGHLGLVSNIMTSVGGMAHFQRPNFPVSTGYYPKDFILHLAPFNMDTLEHFIFLERPIEKKISDNPEFTETEENFKRETPKDRLMTFTGNYKTVGDLYKTINEGILYLCNGMGEEILFCGPKNLQLSPDDIKLDGLNVILDKTSAINAINFIVEQGEGGIAEGCHFDKFSKIKKEYLEMLKANPNFSPGRTTVKNPVMRNTSETEKSNWVNDPTASMYLDIANALYNLMLKFLVQVYSMEHRSKEMKKNLVDSAFIIMKVMGEVSTLLTKFPATTDSAISGNAGMSFTIDRYMNPYEISSEKTLLHERVNEIIEQLKKIDELKKFVPQLKNIQKLIGN
jgi:hypothetical protein